MVRIVEILVFTMVIINIISIRMTVITIIIRVTLTKEMIVVIIRRIIMMIMLMIIILVIIIYKSSRDFSLSHGSTDNTYS